MPSPPTSHPVDPDVAAQRARIAALEAAFWEGDLRPADLERFQSAYRELEVRVAAQRDDRRHHFVIVTKTCIVNVRTDCGSSIDQAHNAVGTYGRFFAMLEPMP